MPEDSGEPPGPPLPVAQSGAQAEDVRTFTSDPVEMSSQLAVFAFTGETQIARSIPDATPLGATVAQGEDEAEEATKRAASFLGFPDFVFDSRKTSIGGGANREIAGDGAVISGRRALLISSKSRTAPSGIDDKERNWLDAKIRGAYKQAVGSMRRLRNHSYVLTNRRGRSFAIAGDDYDWTIVIIVNHDSPPIGYTPRIDEKCNYPSTVVILRRDWEFLHDYLRSTAAVVDYLASVAGEQIELGMEPFRYYRCAISASGQGESPLMRFPGSEARSESWLPLEPVPEPDLHAHLLLRAIMVQVSQMDVGDGNEPARLEALSVLDAVPVTYRTDLGKFLLSEMRRVEGQESSDQRIAVQRLVVERLRPYVIQFMVASELSGFADRAMDASTLKSHVDYLRLCGLPSGLTVSVMLVPPEDKALSWRTALKVFEGSAEAAEAALDELLGDDI